MAFVTVRLLLVCCIRAVNKPLTPRATCLLTLRALEALFYLKYYSELQANPDEKNLKIIIIA
jgi:hypothetical protein